MIRRRRMRLWGLSRVTSSMSRRMRLRVGLLNNIRLSNIFIMSIKEFRPPGRRGLLSPNHPLIGSSKIMSSLIGGMLTLNATNKMKRMKKINKICKKNS